MSYKVLDRHSKHPVFTNSTEVASAQTTYPNTNKILEGALNNTYCACVAFDKNKITRLLKVLAALPENVVKFYVPTNPSNPILLTAGEVKVKSLLMPIFADWEADKLNVKKTETIKYEEGQVLT